MPNSSNIQGRILVVDDQPANLRVVSALLSRNGFCVRTAEGGEQALEMLTAPGAEPIPDLMLLDMLMPGMDGFALMAQIKQRPELLRLPVVFLTVAQDRDLLLRAFDSGAVDYVTKPFMPEELLARVNAHVGLKMARDRLERVARERQELVNLVAHDLKNPLSSVFFATEMLLGGGIAAERVPRYLQIVRESTEDALGYIRRYLETQSAQSRGRAGDADASASLPQVLGWLDSRYSLQIEDRGSALRIASADNVPPLAIDPLVLRQVCENLISNALKYAPGSDIDILVQGAGPGYWQLRVEDRGPGIPAAKQGGLFKPFVRLDDSVGGDDGISSGLGLSLARQIIVSAGGQLWYEGREQGGARFIIELPEAIVLQGPEVDEEEDVDARAES
ncbi:hybrid sensor histidine kinase/response regulator [Luteimonas sp. RIT-PG2_3]